jgi:hypothetical protein
MVPWYTVEPPINGLCPKSCSCAKFIVNEYVQETLECLYDRHVNDITDQFPECQTPTKKSLQQSASSCYWHNKANQLCINPDLMDLAAPLPPCVSDLVLDNIQNMLEDFVDLEEWFFAFEKALQHEKDDILEGYVNGTYRTTIKKRRDDHAIAFNVIADNQPVFGPPAKKMRQTTLTQVFNGFNADDRSLDNCKPKAVIDLTKKQPGAVQGHMPKFLFNVTIDLTNHHPVLAREQSHAVEDYNPHIATAPHPHHRNNNVHHSSFTTPPPYPKTRGF